MHKHSAVASIAAFMAALALAAAPAAQARGHFDAPHPSRAFAGAHFARGGHFGRPGNFGHFDHFARSAPHFAARAIGPRRFAPGRFRAPFHPGPRFAPGVHVRRPFARRPAARVPNFAPDARRIGNDHFRRFGDEDHLRRYGDGDHFRRFGDDDGDFPRLPDWHRRFWAGGYWGGQFWPQVYYGASFDWFLTALPTSCPVYWYDNVPYYYYDDVYYVWSPQYDGYVVADPPPVGVASPAGQQNLAEDSSATGALDAAAAAGSDASTYANSTDAEVFAYPRHGQSVLQQQKDRRQCARWAAKQTSSQATVTVADYRQAMIACFEARGYSAR